MTWHYELDDTNDRIRLRFEDDGGTVHGPYDLAWPGAPTHSIAPGGWIVDPDTKEFVGEVLTDEWLAGNQLLALQMLRDLAAGEVVEGSPEPTTTTSVEGGMLDRLRAVPGRITSLFRRGD